MYNKYIHIWFLNGVTKVNLMHLRYIIEVEKYKSITKAAQNLYMGQPNLSKAIKDLESTIGITIFKRTAKGVEPTEKGAEFLNYSKTILSQIDELESLYKPKNQDTINFKVSLPRATYISVALSSFINSFSNESQINIHFKETNSTDAINDVATGESDIAVVRYQDIYEDHFLNLLRYNHLEHKLLWEFNLNLLMSAEHPLAKYSDVPFHMLSNYTEIVHGDYQVPSVSFSEIKKNSTPASERRRIFVYDRGSQYDLLREVYGSFMWVSPMPSSVLERNNLVQRTCSLSKIINKDIIIYPTKQKYNSVCDDFIEQLKLSVKKLK